MSQNYTHTHNVNGYLNNYKKYVLLNVSVFTDLLAWESLKSATHQHLNGFFLCDSWQF